VPSPALLAVADEITRESARDAARRELAKPIYTAERPDPAERVLDGLGELLARLLDLAVRTSPGGGAGLAGLLLLAVVAVIALRFATGPLARSGRAASFDLLVRPQTAQEHRRRAEEYAAAGRYAEAVRERMRAIARELESRGLLEPRPGRTAGELAREAGQVVPDLAADLRQAAAVFDEIWYGGRAATPGADATLRAVDQRVRQARPARVAAG